MCRTLGLHQVHSMKDDSPQKKADKSLLFWCTYMLDKGLSLRLGRASILQDYDISLPHIVPETRAATYPGNEVMTLWIKHAQIQGRIYERLYSPGALRQSETYRAEQVGILTSEQKHLMAESLALFAEFNATDAAEGRMFAIMLKSDEVVCNMKCLIFPNHLRSRYFLIELYKEIYPQNIFLSIKHPRDVVTNSV